MHERAPGVLARARTALLFAALTLLAACAEGPGRGGSEGPRLDPPPASPEAFGAVAPFAFTERGGRAVGPQDLRGAPWIAAFVFTRCSTICPRMTGEMRRAQDLLEGGPVRLVSITVDPEFDTLEVLRDYADEFAGADPERWWFLRGEQQAVDALITQSFMLPIARLDAVDPGIAITHSSSMIVVDGEGAIRGYYDADSPEGVERAVARARFLAGERPAAPLRNAALNGTAAALLLAGWIAIRGRRRELHAWLMRAAFVASALFLVSYLHYHFAIIPAQGGPVRYGGVGALKAFYLVLLLTHVVGAVVNLPMVLRTLWLAHRERWEDHKRFARRTFPLWMYVSVTGVLVYLMLYPWNPGVG